jgi:hypothetical protein
MPSFQDILAYFTRPTRSVNHRAIREIRTGSKHATIKPAAAEDLDEFLLSWPQIDPETGSAAANPARRQSSRASDGNPKIGPACRDEGSPKGLA